MKFAQLIGYFIKDTYNNRKFMQKSCSRLCPKPIFVNESSDKLPFTRCLFTKISK